MTSAAQPYQYAFDNQDHESADRHQYLSTILDDFTCSRLASLGDLSGRRCLEVGAGGGSVAEWLARQVGPTGRVLATDLDPRHIPTDRGYEVRQHDLIAEPVPDGPWDLIHARLVLMHLKPRHEIFPRLVSALAPGGAILIEEWDSTVGNCVLAAPDPEAAALLESFQEETNRLLRARGADQTWSRRVHSAMLEAGLERVDTTLHARSWPGGTAGAVLLTVTLAQLRDEFRAAGFTEEQLQRIEQLAHDPRVVWRGLLTYSTVGFRP